MVKAGGIPEPAGLRFSTGAMRDSRSGTIGNCSSHMPCIVITLDVSHFEMFWLKRVADRNLSEYILASRHWYVPASPAAKTAALTSSTSL